MRIRKRSVGLLSSSIPTSENPEGCNSSGHGDEVQEKKEREEFLLPLVAAVMDVQAKAQAQAQILGLSTPTSMDHGISEIGVRRHNWRDALLRFGADSQQATEGDKSDYQRWDMMIMRNPQDKFQRLQCKESGLLEDSSTRVKAQGFVAVEKKRASVNGDRNADLRVSSNETMLRNSKPNMKSKNENYHGGSQCKRRNGRGWRCSQWTLVGYSLCEHHLGKSRFKNINATNSAVTVAVNSKGIGSKFKELHLVHAASPKVEIP